LWGRRYRPPPGHEGAVGNLRIEPRIWSPGGRHGGAAQPLADSLCWWRFKLWLRSGGILAVLETKAFS